MTWDVLFDQGSLSDIPKTASLLNLEEMRARQQKTAALAQVDPRLKGAVLALGGTGAALGLAGAAVAKRRRAAEGKDPNDIGYASSTARGAGRALGDTVLGGIKGSVIGSGLGHLAGLGAGYFVNKSPGGLVPRHLLQALSKGLGARAGAVLGTGVGTLYGAGKGLATAYLDPRRRAEARDKTAALQDHLVIPVSLDAGKLGRKALAIGGAGAALGLTGAAVAREDRSVEGKDPSGIRYVGSAVRGAGESLGGAARGGLTGLGLGVGGGALAGSIMGFRRGVLSGTRNLRPYVLTGAGGGALLGGKAGLTAGGLYGAGKGLLSAYRDPARRAEARDKTAGLFMRPSDIADHRNLAAALEGKLNGAGQGTQFKLASAPPERMVKAAALSGITAGHITGGAVGAIGGLRLTNQLMGRTLSAPSPIPPPQEPAGLRDRGRALYARGLDRAAEAAQRHPVTAQLVGTAAGAVGGALSAGSVHDRVRSLLRRS